MARYRVGNKYLSQKEYDDDLDNKWVAGLFLIGAFTTGYLLHSYVISPTWNVIFRFTITVLPSFAVGCLLVKFRRFIRLMTTFIISLIVIYIVITSLLKMV